MIMESGPVAGSSVLVGLSLWLYWESSRGDLVFDDRVAVAENRDVTHPHEKGMGDVFSNNFWGDEMGVPWARHHSYRPLTVLTFRWTHMVGGLDPFYFHVGNMVLNAAVTLLFQRTSHLFLKHAVGAPLLVSYGAAALFAVHPVHCEAVAGIVGRADLLAAFFGQLAILSYARGCGATATASFGTETSAKQPGVSVLWILATLFWAGCAMLSKETGICVIGVIATFDVAVLCDIQPLELLPLLATALHAGAGAGHTQGHRKKKGASQATARATPAGAAASLAARLGMLLVGTLLLLGARFWMNRDDVVEVDWSTNPANQQEPRSMRVLTKLYYNVWHAWLLIWPEKLAADWACYSIPVVEDVRDPRNLWSAGLLALLVGSTLFAVWPSPRDANAARSTSASPARSIKHFVLLCIVLTVVPFLPSCGMILNVGFVVADRLLYIPSQGVCLLVAGAVFGALERAGGALPEAGGGKPKKSGKQQPHRSTAGASKGVYAAVMILLCAVATIKTRARSAEWLNEQTLFKTAMLANPGNCRMHHNYATTLDDVLDFKEKEFHLSEAIRLWPVYGSAYTNLGVIYAKNDQLEKAVQVWKDGLAKGRNVVGGDKPVTVTNIAVGLRNLGRYEESLEFYQQAAALRPNEPRVINGLRNVKEIMGLD